MKQQFKRIALGLFLSTVVSSCSENEPNSTNSTVVAEEKGLATQLGEKLENPYSVANMKKALANLRKSKSAAKMAADDFEITTTHLYLKFTPKNEQELDVLESDSTIVFYDHPLDYEIAVSGDYYRDPNIPEDQPTPLYCAVKVDAPVVQNNGKIKGNAKVMETVEKTTLEELFIPDEDFDTDENGTTNKTVNPAMRKINGKMLSVSFIDALVEEALRITNNLNNSNAQNKTLKTASSKWRPAGRIRVWDDYLQDYIGVEGAEVRARRWFTTHRGWVGADGYYSCDGRFERDANYSIDWDRYEFAIQDHWLNGATFNGPKKEGNWDLNLKDDKQAYYATIFSGAYFYYYKDRMELTSPPTNSFFKRKLRIKARLENSKSSYVKARRIWFGADISLQAWGDRSDLVFGTTIHELAHAAHREVAGGAYNNLVWKAYSSPCAPSAESCDHPGPTGASARRVMETWATTVEIVLTNLRYKKYLGYSNFEYGLWRVPSFNNNQNVFITEENFYTSAGYDLIDSFNQRDVYGSFHPQDRVSGYTIKQVENSLKNTNSWSEWKENVKRENPNNPTNQYIDELFNNW
jgi:hypothetical protein